MAAFARTRPADGVVLSVMPWMGGRRAEALDRFPLGGALQQEEIKMITSVHA